MQFLREARRIILTPLSPYSHKPRSSFCFSAPLQPKQIRLKKAEKTLYLTWEDQTTSQLSAEYLRVMTPSAERVGHGPTPSKVVSGKRGVGIQNVQLVGNYALRIMFSDFHDSGIYSFRYLNELSRSKYPLMKQYLKDLQAAGKSRDPIKKSTL